VTRYFLSELGIEGFRGINNLGDPLNIRLQPTAVNSIHAPNGVGKTSIFEAIHYAIFDSVPRLSQLQEAEQPATYINNRFHLGPAVIALTFTSDDGSGDVKVTVRRTAVGVRSTTSETGHPDPEGFLRSLREDFVLVDYRKFARFIDNTALVRGRSFAALVGLSRYSTLRRVIEGAKQTQSLNTDFEMRLVETEITTSERQLADYARRALAAYTEVTSLTVADLAHKSGLCSAVTAALREIDLVQASIGTADIMNADLDAAEMAVEAAEGGPLRQQHTQFTAKVAALKELAANPAESAERTLLLKAADDRDAALLKAGSSLLRELYQSAATVVADSDWTNPFLCPVCDTQSSHRLDEHIAGKLAQYSQADKLSAALGSAAVVAESLARLGKLETSAHLAVPLTERRHAVVMAAARQNTLTTSAL
jgi:hypothetical protein